MSPADEAADAADVNGSPAASDPQSADAAAAIGPPAASEPQSADSAAGTGSPAASDPQQSSPQQQQQQQPDKQPGSQQQGEGAKEAVNARAAALDIVLQKDAFLVFRALCKLTIKTADSGADVTATRGKVQSSVIN